MNIETMVATGVAATAFFQCYLDGLNALQWIQVSGTIYARSLVAGVSTDHFSASWSGTTYKYLRIRENAGNIEWQSSTNGTTWTTRATVAVSSLFAITDLYIDFGAICGNVASPGSFRLDDVNIILPALSTTWRWAQPRRPLTDRYKRVTLAIDTVNTAQGYLITADGVDVSGAPSGNVRYWSGPSGGGRLLTEQSTQADAEAMAVDIPLDGTFDLPTMVDARVVRLGMRSVDGNSFILREFYPRRLVQSDDIEAESIRAINIAAGQITVDKLDATLTITGKTIQTAYNGARVVLSGAANGGFIGYGATDTYSPGAGTGTYQVLWKLTDGKFYAGGGIVRLDANGVSVETRASGGAYNLTNAYRIIKSDGTVVGTIGSYLDSGTHFVGLRAESVASEASQVDLHAVAPSGQAAAILIHATAGSFDASITMSAASGNGLISINVPTDFASSVDADSLNIGTSTGAGAGQIKTSGNVGFGDALGATVRCLSRGSDTGSSNYGFLAQDSAGTTTFFARNDGRVSATVAYLIGGTQVVNARKTGWGAPTGTATRTTFATGSVTLVQLAERVKALIDDFTSHGLIGA